MSIFLFNSPKHKIYLGLKDDHLDLIQAIPITYYIWAEDHIVVQKKKKEKPFCLYSISCQTGCPIYYFYTGIKSIIIFLSY